MSPLQSSMDIFKLCDAGITAKLIWHYPNNLSIIG
jgi:hypothetical protein